MEIPVSPTSHILSDELKGQRISFCEPCKFRCAATRSLAAKYCKICSEPLCKTCSDVHQSSKATRKHLLVNMSDIRKTTIIGKDLESFQKCPHHSGKDLEYFCFSRENFYCTLCMFSLSEEIDFDTLCDIAVAGDTLVENKFDQVIVKYLRNVIETCKEEEAKIKIQRQGCVNSRSNLEKELDETRQKLLAVFDKYKKQILDKASKAEEAAISLLDNELRTVVDTKTTFQENKDMLQTVIKTGSREEFFRCTLSIIRQISEVTEKPIRNFSSDHILGEIKYSPSMTTFLNEKTPAMTYEIQTSTQDSVSFQTFDSNRLSFLEMIKCATIKRIRNEESENSLASADGDFEKDRSPKSATDPGNNMKSDMKLTVQEADQSKLENPHVGCSSLVCDNFVNKRKNEDSGKTLQDCKPFENDIQVINLSTVQIPVQNHCDIQGIATLPDGRIVLTDRHESKLILLNRNFTFLESITLQFTPGKVAVLNGKYLAICLPDSCKVAIRYIKPELRWIRNFITNSKPMDISAIDDEKLLISFLDKNMSWNLRILSDEGKLLRTIGRTRVLMDASIIACHSYKVSNESLYLQCCKKSKSLYCFDKNGIDYFRYSVDNPSGVCVDNDGMIYVIDSTGKLHVLSRDGKLVLLKDIGANASSISYNSSTNRLLVVKNQFRNIIVFEVQK